LCQSGEHGDGDDGEGGAYCDGECSGGEAAGVGRRAECWRWRWWWIGVNAARSGKCGGWCWDGFVLKEVHLFFLVLENALGEDPEEVGMVIIIIIAVAFSKDVKALTCSCIMNYEAWSYYYRTKVVCRACLCGAVLADHRPTIPLGINPDVTQRDLVLTSNHLLSDHFS
jgi:hypothetical protein